MSVERERAVDSRKSEDAEVDGRRAALRDDEETFRLFIASASDYAIFMLDADGRIASWNAGAARLKGYSAQEIIGRHFSIFYPQAEIAADKPGYELKVATAEGSFEEEGWRLRKDGSRFWARVVITALYDEAGKVRGFAKVTRDFTERRRSEETARRLDAETTARRVAEEGEAGLRASEERLRQQSRQLAIILEGVADGITAHDADGRLYYANDAAAHTCGYATAAELLNASPGEARDRFDVFDEAGNPVTSDHLPGRRALAGERDPQAVVRLRMRATGDEWWSLIKSSAVLDSEGKPSLAVNIWRDVTEQRRAEAQTRFLGEASAVLGSGLEFSTTLDRLAALSVPRLADFCAVHVAEGGEILAVAVAHSDPTKIAAARDMLRRYPADPNAARGVAAVVRTGVAELHSTITDAWLAERARDDEQLRTLRALGLSSLMVVPLLARGRALGALTLVSAESRRRFGPDDLKLAEELGRRAGLALENARLYRDATDAIRLRDEFLSVAGHELKTPLAALMLQIAGLVRLLENDPIYGGTRFVERLRKTTNYGARLGKLIDELLDIARVTSGRLHLEHERVDLTATVAELVARFAEESARAASPITVTSPAEPVVGRWDRLRLEQVVTNLLSNALKYGVGHGIEVTLSRSGSEAILTVRDQGIGIAPEHQVRIFGRFERAVSERNYGGLGLGLWIARQIVEAHGGAISVASARGEGATFTVALPC